MQVVYREIVYAVGAVADEFTPPHIAVIYIAVVAVRSELEHIGSHPVVITAAVFGRNRLGLVVDAFGFVRCEMPFADIRGVVAGGIEQVGETIVTACRQLDVVSKAAGASRVPAALQAGARRTADRLTGERVRVSCPLGGDRVEVRCDRQPLTVAAESVPTLLVGEVKDDIRTGGHRFIPFLDSSICIQTILYRGLHD